MIPRSNRAEVRNPILGLPAFVKLRDLLAPEQKVAVRALLYELCDDASARAEKAWRTRKAPMAVYWKAVAVYSRHIARAIGGNR